MPSVKCPIPGCTYATGNLDPVVVAALLNAHSVVHRGIGASGAVLDASSSTMASGTSVYSDDGPLTPHLR